MDAIFPFPIAFELSHHRVYAGKGSGQLSVEDMEAYSEKCCKSRKEPSRKPCYRKHIELYN